ncbi:MAG: sigma-54 dependent transcriptional regulator [candidate division FCPU426 bacterium]
MAKILIVDDNPDILDLLVERLRWEGFEVQTAQDAETALAAVRSQPPEALLLDVFLGQGPGGLEVLRGVRRDLGDNSPPVLVITGQPDSGLLLEAMQAGAADFITKPIDLAELAAKLKRLTVAAPRPSPTAVWEARIVGKSQAMLDATMQVFQSAQKGLDTLILGETGTGKDLAAAMIHRLGPRRDGPFVMLDCTNIPPALFESELFGHEKGSFTSAEASRAGRLTQAHGGVLFLNEIGELPPDQQKKFLTFLERREFHPVGGRQPVRVDVQVVAATNQPLGSLLSAGQFRQDLYQRLKGQVIQLPPLREHPEDIPLLVEHFLAELNPRLKQPVTRVEPEVYVRLGSLAWEGNVRELRKRTEAAAQQCPDGVLHWRDFQMQAAGRPANSGSAEKREQPYRQAKEALLRDFHRDYLGRYLQKHQGNVSEAARAMGLAREQLNQLLRRYGIQRPPKNQA